MKKKDRERQEKKEKETIRSNIRKKENDKKRNSLLERVRETDPESLKNRQKKEKANLKKIQLKVWRWSNTSADTLTQTTKMSLQ